MRLYQQEFFRLKIDEQPGPAYPNDLDSALTATLRPNEKMQMVRKLRLASKIF